MPESGAVRADSEGLVSGEQGSVLTVLITFFVFLAIFLGLIFFVFGTIVWPNTIGLRQNYFNIPGLLTKGYVSEGLEPGLHWKIPGLSNVHLIKRDFQVINLNRDSRGGDLDLAQLEIPTTDGSKVQTDFTLILRYFSNVATLAEADEAPVVEKGDYEVPFVSYRPRAHGGPRELVNTYTLNQDKQLRTLAKKAEDFLKRSLSKLSTTDYYNAGLRENAALSANQKVNDTVNKDGVELWATLIRRYIYSEKNIDDQIFAKNLQEQTEHVNVAKSALAEAQAKTEQNRAHWDAKIKVLKVEGAAKVRVIKSEAELYQQSKIAEGDKLVQFAVAEVEGAKNSIYASPGGDIFVARKMLPIISSLRGGVLSDLDPFDLNAWVDRLVAGRKTRSAQ